MTDKTNQLECEALKPCPFCGGEARIMHEEVDCDGYYIFCTECKAHSVGMLTDNYKSKGLDARQEVIKTWNTRKPMERIVEQLEEKRDWHAKAIGTNFQEKFDLYDKGSMNALNDAINIVKVGAE